MCAARQHWQDNYQQQLHELTELRKAILDSTNLSIISVDSSGIIQIFNHAAEKMLGYSSSEVVQIKTPAIFHDAREVQERARQLSEELGRPVEPGLETFIIKSRLLGVPDTNEWTCIDKAGKRFPVLLTVTALFGKKGDLAGFVGIAMDLREQKGQLSRLQDSEELFRVLFETSSDAHVLVAPGIGFINANRAAAEFYGYKTIEEFTALSPATVSPEFQKDGRRSDEKSLEMMQLALKNGSHHFEWQHKRANGSIFDAEVFLSRVNIGGKTIIAGLLRDITERNRAERAKKEFISTVSHELRTPLTSICGVLSLLEQGVLGQVSTEARPMIQMAHKKSQQLSGLINDLLDLEKLDAGQMVINLKTHNLTDIIDQSLDATSDVASQFHVNFVVNNEEHAQVVVDDVRLIQVLNNLFSNAAKFSHTDSQVDITVREIHNSENSVVRVEVDDRGVGIPASFRKHLFQKFSQVDASDTKKNGGTGLGLALSKELIERMSGVIGYYARYGGGSCFYIELPLADKASN